MKGTLFQFGLPIMVCVLAGCGPGKYAPEFRPQVGDKQSASFVDNEFITVEAMGQSYVLASRASLRYDMEVIAIDPAGMVELRCTFGPVKFQLDNAIAKILASAQVVDFGQVARILEGAQGESFTAYIAKDGTVRHVNALGLTDRMLSKAKLQTNAARGSMRFWVDRFLSDSRLRDQMKGIFYMYTSTPVSVGQSWSKQDTFGPAGSTLPGVATLTLASIENGLATINESVTMSSESQGQVSLAPGADMKLSSSGSGHGQYVIDTESGWLKRFNSDQKITGNATITGQTALSVNVTMDVASSATFE